MAILRRQFSKLLLAAGAAVPSKVALGTSPESSSPPIDEFVDYDALGLAQLIKTGQLSAQELAEVIIRRIEALEPIVNAISIPCFGRARAKANDIPKASTFAGVPILIKDMIDVGGIPRTDGSRLMLDNTPASNVAYIDGIEEAGMNIIGMTNVPEFAQLGLNTENSVFGRTRNPWDLSTSALGSSGGAAVAVASGMVPLAHGTDGGGSNRLPASANGVFGMKPSYGRMRSGEADGGHSPVKTNQTLSRSVRDSAALFDHTEDKSGRLYEPAGFVTELSTCRLKVGVFSTPGSDVVVEPAVVTCLDATRSLLEELGHEVHEVTSPVNAPEFFHHYNGAFLRRFQVYAELAAQRSGRPAAYSGLLDPWTVSLIAFGASISAEQEARGQEYLATVADLYASRFADVDVLLSPVMPAASVSATAIRPTDTVSPEKLKFLQDGMSFTAPTNIAGVPAMSLPLYWDPVTGLPIGSMFQAPRGADKLLYQLAYELEMARPWKDRWAPHSVKFASRY